MENVNNTEGLRLVVDRKDEEFYLLAQPDKSGILHGKIKNPKFLFNVKRGETNDGVFSGALEVSNIPFEFIKYSDVHIEHLLESTTKKEIKIVEHTFEYFDPAKFESGVEIIPPRSLSRKQRKTWYRECKEWKESTKNVSEDTSVAEETVNVSDALPTTDSDPNSDSSGPDHNGGKSDDEKALPVINETMEKAGVDISKVNKKEEFPDPIAGKGNTECLFVDYPQGYMLAYHNTKTNVYAVLGTPAYPNIQGFRRFFVCENERSAHMLLDKLAEHPFYAKFVKDGSQECKVYPITNLPVDKWNVPALHVLDVMKLLNSRLMA